MRKSIVTGLVTALLMVAGLGSSQAEVILTDDPGFGVDSIILDVDNNKEFLRLDFTTPYTYNEVVSEFGAGGAFEGWSVASRVDMDLLGLSANLVRMSSDPIMVTRAEQLRDWFGAVNLSSTHEYSRGLISDFFYPSTYGGTRAQFAFSIGTRFNVTPTEVSFGSSGYGGLDHRNEEIFLVRDAAGSAPEPDTGEEQCVPSSGREKAKTCRDGVDNDCDGLIDAADPDCFKKEGKGKTCSDGIDNDGDQLIDCADPGCSGSRVCR